jgi:hypothetical protein
MESRYDIIKSFSQVKRLVKACLKTGIASVDFETNAEGIYNKTFKPTILSVTFQVGSGVFHYVTTNMKTLIGNVG